MSRLIDMIGKAQRTLMKRGLSREDAEDCVQDAYLRIDDYERRHEVRSREALLVRSAVNLSIDQTRKSRRRATEEITEIGAIADSSPGPAEVLEHQLRLSHVALGLDSLPERTRRILLMRRIDNLPYSEIARRESMSVSAVEKQVARATLRLTQWMEGW